MILEIKEAVSKGQSFFCALFKNPIFEVFYF